MAVHALDADIAGSEANEAKEQKVERRNDEQVANVQKFARQIWQIETHDAEKDAIRKQPKRTGSTGNKGTPLPAVLFGAQMQIAVQNTHGRSSQQRYDKGEREEPKGIVHAVAKQGVDNKEELEPGGTEWQQAGEQSGRP